MKTILIFSAMLLMSTQTIAAPKKSGSSANNVESSSIPAPVKKAADKMQLQSVRTLITPIKNEEGNPCIPEGTSYNTELQVKQAHYNAEKKIVEYNWETVKTVNINTKGEVMEACGE